MVIKGNVKEKTYKKMMKYIISKCDVISVSRHLNYDIIENNRVIDIILSDKNMSKSEIINNYSEKYLEKVSEAYKDNKVIFNEKYISKFKLNHKLKRPLSCFKYEQRKRYIKNAIRWSVYDYNVTAWLKKFQNDLIYIKNKDSDYVTYYFRMSENLKYDILSKNSLYDWKYPLSIEDIAFFKNKYCLFCSEIHEEMCDLYCKDENEYKYFKSIGIEFYDSKYIQEHDKGLPYNNYYN